MSSSYGRIKAVLFDLGGTLIKAAPVPEIFRRILKAYGVRKPLSKIASAQKEIDDQLTSADYGLPYGEFWAKWNLELLKRLGVQGDLLFMARTITERWWDFADLGLYSDVIETFDHLRRRGFKLGLVTNGFKSDIDAILPRVGLDGYFDIAVGVDDVGKPKPSKEVFLFALDRLNIRPSEAVFVGDALEADYEGAQRAGLTALLIDREDKIKGSFRKIRRLGEIGRYLE